MYCNFWKIQLNNLIDIHWILRNLYEQKSFAKITKIIDNQKLYWVILHIYAHTHTTSFAKSRWVNESDLDKCSLAIFFTTCTSWPPLHWNTFPKGIAFEYTWYNDGQNDQTSTQNIDHQRLMMALNGFCILISNSCEYFFIVFVSCCCAINKKVLVFIKRILK